MTCSQQLRGGLWSHLPARGFPLERLAIDDGNELSS
jgi:hypothetical protein